jgi:hypothetical protein
MANESNDLWSFLKERCTQRMFNKIRLLLNGYRRSVVGGWWMHPPQGHPVVGVTDIRRAIERSTGVNFSMSHPVSMQHIADEHPALSVAAVRELAACELYLTVFGTDPDDDSFASRFILEQQPVPYLSDDTRQLLKRLCYDDASKAMSVLLPTPLEYGSKLLTLLVHNVGTLLYNGCAPHLSEAHLAQAADYEDAIRMLDQVLFIGARTDDVSFGYWLEP